MEYLESQVADNGAAGAASVTIPVPVATLDGDLLVMNIAARGGTGCTIATPAGWFALQNNANGTTTRLASFYRFASAEPASYTPTFSSSQQAVGSISLYRALKAVDATGPNTGTSANPTAFALSLFYAYELLIAVYAHGTGDVFTDPPIEMTERLQQQSAAALDTDRVTLAVYDQSRQKPGSTGQRVATAGLSAAWVAHLFGFQPEAADVSDSTGRLIYVTPPVRSY